MPLHWKIDAQQKLATATAEGDVTRAEIEALKAPAPKKNAKKD